MLRRREPGVYPRQTVRYGPPGGFGLTGPPPRDLIVLLAVVFVTFTLRFFEVTAAVPALLELTPWSWRSGLLWQLVTYGFVGSGRPDLWFILELIVLYLFARSVLVRIGRRRFWQLLVAGVLAAGVVAVAVDILTALVAGPMPQAFVLMQGQRTLIVILIAAFATLFADATILLFFVLPIQARWFIWLEIGFGFLGFLATKDLAGFIGICMGVVAGVAMVGPGGPRWMVWRWRKRLEKLILERRLRRMRRRRNLRVVDDEPPSDHDRWVH
jgi:hypothetical protein